MAASALAGIPAAEAKPAFAMLEMEVADIALGADGQTFAVLREHDGHKQFAIRVSRHTAVMMQSAMSGQAFPRPLTYELVLTVIDALGGRCVRAVADADQQALVSPFLEVDAPSGMLELACTLEDAVGIAACAHVPVMLSDDLLRLLRESRQPDEPP